MAAMVQPKRPNNNSEADTDDMLTALRRQLQPHLVMALQGHTTMSYPGGVQVSTYFKTNEFSLHHFIVFFSHQGMYRSCRNNRVHQVVQPLR